MPRPSPFTHKTRPIRLPSALHQPLRDLALWLDQGNSVVLQGEYQGKIRTVRYSMDKIEEIETDEVSREEDLSETAQKVEDSVAQDIPSSLDAGVVDGIGTSSTLPIESAGFTLASPPSLPEHNEVCSPSNGQGVDRPDESSPTMVFLRMNLEEQLLEVLWQQRYSMEQTMADLDSVDSVEVALDGSPLPSSEDSPGFEVDESSSLEASAGSGKENVLWDVWEEEKLEAQGDPSTWPQTDPILGGKENSEEFNNGDGNRDPASGDTVKTDRSETNKAEGHPEETVSDSSIALKPEPDRKSFLAKRQDFGYTLFHSWRTLAFQGQKGGWREEIPLKVLYQEACNHLFDFWLKQIEQMETAQFQTYRAELQLIEPGPGEASFEVNGRRINRLTFVFPETHS